MYAGSPQIFQKKRFFPISPHLGSKKAAQAAPGSTIEARAVHYHLWQPVGNGAAAGRFYSFFHRARLLLLQPPRPNADLWGWGLQHDRPIGRKKNLKKSLCEPCPLANLLPSTLGIWFAGRVYLIAAGKKRLSRAG